MKSKSTDALLAMMMLAVILLVWTRATHAALEAMEQAYEVDASRIERWPLGDQGSLVLRPCESCDSVTLTVTPNTRYRSSQSSLNITREELLQVKAMIRDLDDAFVYVFYRPDDGVVNRIVLDAGN